MGQIVYKGKSYGDKDVTIEAELIDPTELELSEEQMNGEKPINLDIEHVVDGATTKVKMKVPTSLVISNGVVVNNDQKAQVFTKSEEVNEVVADQGYKLIYGEMGQRFIWQGVNVLFGKMNVIEDQSVDWSNNGSTSILYGHTHGKTLNDIYYFRSGGEDMTPLWTDDIPAYYLRSGSDSYCDALTSLDGEPESNLGSIRNKNYWFRDIETNEVYHGTNQYAWYRKLTKPADEDFVNLNKERITAADRIRIAESGNTIEKSYIPNFITKDDLYSYAPFYKIRNNLSLYISGSNLNVTRIIVKLKTDSAMEILLHGHQYYSTDNTEAHTPFLLPSTVDTFGFFFWCQKWSEEGPAVGLGVAGFEGDDLVFCIPIPYISSIHWVANNVTPWRTYYKMLKTNIKYGYLNEGKTDIYTTSDMTTIIDNNRNKNCLYYDYTTKKYYTTDEAKYYSTSVTEDNDEYVVFTGGTGFNTSSSFKTNLSNADSPEYKYAAGVTAKYEHVTKTQFEEISGIGLDASSSG